MKPRVLMICPYPPAPPTSGRAIRMLYLIEGLSRDAVIDLIMNDTGPIAEADMTRLKACCRRVCVAPHRQRSKLSQLPHIVGKVLRGEPFDTKYAEGPELTRMVRDMATNGAYESIVVEESRMAMALMALPPNHGARTVLAMNDVAYVQIRSICRRERNPYEKLKQFLTWWPMRTWEPLMASRFDIVVTVSESDRRLLLARRSGLNVVVVPNGVDTKLYRPVPREGRKERMLFVGALDYSPNVDAAKFLGRDILPRVLEKRPHSACVIVGRAPGRKVKDLANLPGVTIEGDVADVRPYYASAAVAVTPLRSGGGTRLKILEAMALGIPVVSTTLGCEGLNVEDGVDLLIADGAEDFSEQVCRVLSDEDLWMRLAANGRERVEREYDWDGIVRSFRDAVLGPGLGKKHGGE